jgi:hypothetical protein
MNELQVPVGKGNSALSTQPVDKFVHHLLREEFCAGNARVLPTLAKKAPHCLTPIKSNS